MQYRILLVDDDQSNVYATQVLLGENGYEVDVAVTAQEAVERIRSAAVEYAVVLLDYRMPEKNGATIAREMLVINPELFILIYSGDDSREAIRSTFKAGAVDFIEKGNGHSEFLGTIQSYCRKYDETRRTLRSSQFRGSNEDVIASIGMVGRSDAMTDAARRVIRFRESEESVLILGETGTGKELVARALRGDPSMPFQGINCAAYKANTNLLESELFGYEKGSFTGASSSRIGILETLRGGIAFFDELHQLGLDAQAKLLRAFQEKKIRRVGGQTEYAIHFRVVTAAKPGLEDLVKRGEFLPDLYYRLNVLTINLPSLRERPEDVEPLVSHFAARWEKKYQKRKSFRMKTVRILEKYSWPGNIRELENSVNQLLTSCDGSAVEPSELDPKFFHVDADAQMETLPQLKARHEREELGFIEVGLRTARSKVDAAKRLGVSPNTLHSKMIKFGLYKEDVGP